MKFFLSFNAAFAIITSVSSLSLEARGPSSGHLNSRQVSTLCGDPSTAVPFLRAYQPQVVDHFYSTSASEIASEIATAGYLSEPGPGNIFTTQQPTTLPFFRLFSAAATDHFYTTSATERDSFIASGNGYVSQGTAGFIYPTPDCGGIPLFRQYNPQMKDHFYTTSASEAQISLNIHGYTDEGIAGYILPGQVVGVGTR